MLWKAHRPKLLLVISCVAYLLFPDPVVQNHTKEHSTSQDRNAAEFFIEKWLTPEDVIGEDRLSVLADKCLEFWNKYGM